VTIYNRGARKSDVFQGTDMGGCAQAQMEALSRAQGKAVAAGDPADPVDRDSGAR